jgi:hypothetical protein
MATADDCVPVCRIGGRSIYYGTQLEADACELREGDKIIVDGIERIVDYVWFYEHPIVALKGGGSVIPAFGQTFSKVKADES